MAFKPAFVKPAGDNMVHDDGAGDHIMFPDGPFTPGCKRGMYPPAATSSKEHVKMADRFFRASSIIYTVFDVKTRLRAQFGPFYSMNVGDKNLIAIKTADLLFTEMGKKCGWTHFSALLRAETDMAHHCRKMLNIWATAGVIDAQTRDWYLDHLKRGVRDDDEEDEEEAEEEDEGEGGEEESF